MCTGLEFTLHVSTWNKIHFYRLIVDKTANRLHNFYGNIGVSQLSRHLLYCEPDQSNPLPHKPVLQIYILLFFSQLRRRMTFLLLDFQFKVRYLTATLRHTCPDHIYIYIYIYIYMFKVCKHFEHS
jgi:hypothetical protein